jgi:Xaa-Pro aminopeptidase
VSARLAEVALPDFGAPEAVPEIPAAVYADRLARLRARAEEAGYDALVVYADREHSANLSYLTGFDPRFEEAMLLVGRNDEPAILAGNECLGTAGAG